MFALRGHTDSEQFAEREEQAGNKVRKHTETEVHSPGLFYANMISKDLVWMTTEWEAHILFPFGLYSSHVAYIFKGNS